MSLFDTIVVGAGSAGCVVAARLSAEAGRRVLLLEAGGSDKSFLIRKPGMIALIHTVPQVKEKFDWGYKTVPQNDAVQRKVNTVRGKLMGGSSSINGMVFVRGNRANFDGWAAGGCPGWSFDDLLPLYKRMEDYEKGESELRGAGGPVAVTHTTGLSPVSEAFQDAVSETCGVPKLDDYNGESQEGVGVVQVSARDGVRFSTSHAYIDPARGRDNLVVQSGAQVQRLIIENGRCVGVVYTQGGETKTARAREEVVLSAGAIGTPQILMLSGIGPAAHLRAMGISVEADLPVGDNLHDHLLFPMTWTAPRGGHKGTPWHFFSSLFREVTVGGTWLGRSVFEMFAFVKTDPSSPIPDLQLHSMPWAYPADPEPEGRPEVDMRPAYTVQPTLIYPKSRGTVRLRSADPSDKPLIDPRYLSDPSDLELLFRGIQLTREVMNTGAVKGEVREEIEPGPEFFDSQRLRAEIPKRAGTVYHPVGTCRMGSDERAVVDPTLRVRGIEGLRVADGSIMPSITGGNTNAPCILIGEKCADLILGR
jgi:choline dehydrogenase